MERFSSITFGTIGSIATCYVSEFEGDAVFLQCSFKFSVTFGKSSFKKFVIFKAISGKGLFFLYNVKFSDVPDFTEAHFEEAPLFDKR